MTNPTQSVPAPTSPLVPVDFHGTTLYLIEHDGQPYVPMKPVVEGMGMAWQGQHEKITSRFGSTITMILTVAEDGKQREMICLPLRKLPGWLYSIYPNKVAPNLRPRIIAYQNECDDVLWKHGSGQARPATPTLPTPEEALRKFLEYHSFLFTIDYRGVANIRELPDMAIMIEIDKLPSLIADWNGPFPKAVLPAIIHAAAKRLDCASPVTKVA